jgi:hypothetical protein
MAEADNHQKNTHDRQAVGVRAFVLIGATLA